MKWIKYKNRYYPLGIKVLRNRFGIAVQFGFIFGFLIYYDKGIRYDRAALIDGIELNLFPADYEEYCVCFKKSLEWFFKVIPHYKIYRNPGVYGV